MRQKYTFANIFIGLSLLLVLLPFLVGFNQVLTNILKHNLLYIWIQTNVVPLEAKMIGSILIPLGYQYAYSPTNSIIVINGINMEITWNCLGWQSFLLFSLTLIAGFSRKYRPVSIIEALGIGILGTFWLNILRMLFTIILAVHTPAIFRIVYHDYLAALTTVIWLFAYWWFSYKYILE